MDNLDDDYVELIQANRRDCSLEKIKEADTVIIFAHGGDDKIFHSYPDSYTEEEILIDNDNVSILKDKKVIAFSCYTARKLGLTAVNNEECICYMGFFDAINRQLIMDKSCTPSEVEFFLNSINNEAFKKVLIEAVNNNMKIKDICKRLNHEIRISALENIENCGIGEVKFKNKYIPQIMLTIGNTADGIRYYGDGEVRLR